MAYLELNFYSKALEYSTSVGVILPDIYKSTSTDRLINKYDKLQTLYLLHGMHGDHTVWSRRTSIERYASQYKLAVIMPEVQNSFYTDMCNGGRFYTFVTEELPDIARYYFPLSEKREDNFVAGLSMGGYGAFKWALTKPESVCAAASLSGALDIVGGFDLINDKKPGAIKLFTDIFGDLNKVKGSEHDLFYLAQTSVEEMADLPELTFCCGTEDYLYKLNLNFKNHLDTLKIPYTYFEEPGAHTWDFWDRNIKKILEIFPLKKI